MLSARTRLAYGSLVCIIGGLFYCYEFILRIVPGVLQTELSAAFGHITASLFGQIAALYYYAYSPMQLPVGMLMDRFGPRKLLTLACLCCAFGTWMFSYSGSLLIAGIGRFIVGFGSSFAFVGVLSLAFHWLPKKYFSLVAGLITTLSMFGLAYGGLKITEMTALLGLKTALMAITAIGIVLAVVILLVIRDGESREAHNKLQPLHLFMQEVLRVLTNPQIWLIGFVGICLYTSLSVFGELWGQTYLEQAHHLSKIDAAAAMSWMFLGWAVGAPLTGYISDCTNNRLIPLAVSALMALICIMLILYCQRLSYTELKVLLFLYGVFSGAEIIVFILGKERSAIELSGTVFASVNMIVSLGGVVYQPLVGFLLDFGKHGHWSATGRYIYTVDDYQRALAILPASLLVVFIAIYLLRKKK